jgi:hypothetical protein
MSTSGGLDEQEAAATAGQIVSEADLERRRAEVDTYLDTHATWDAIVDRLRETSELISDELRATTTAAITILRRELDEGWPRRFYYGSGSILTEFFWNHVPWTCMMLVLFARALEATKLLTGWPDVRRRLMDPKTADPALLQLLLGARALERNIQPSFEPPGQKARKADLRLELGTTVMNVECTSIAALPDAANEAERISHTIYPPFAMLDLHVGGKVIGPFSDEELQDVAAQAQEFFRQCSTHNRPGELNIPNMVHMWATPINHPEAQVFVDAHGGEVIFSVDFPHDPLTRLVATVDRKARGGQFIPDIPGLLVVEPSRLLSQVNNGDVRFAVRQTLQQYPHINAVALIHQHFGQGPDTAIALSHGDVAIVRNLNPPVQEDVVVVWNQARIYHAGDAIIDQIFRLPDPADSPA